MKPGLMICFCPLECSMTDMCQGTGKRNLVRDSPNFSINRHVVTRQTAEAKGEIKLESYTCWQHPFAFQCVWPPQQQGPATSDGLTVITQSYKYLFRLSFHSQVTRVWWRGLVLRVCHLMQANYRLPWQAEHSYTRACWHTQHKLNSIAFAQPNQPPHYLG